MAIKVNKKEQEKTIDFPCLMTNEVYETILMISQDEGLIFQEQRDGGFEIAYESGLNSDDFEVFNGKVVLSNK